MAESARYDDKGFEPETGRCPYCGRKVEDEDFTPAQLKDYSLTGVCALCQKDIDAAILRWDSTERPTQRTAEGPV